MTKDDVLAAVIASAKADGSWTATYMKERWLLPGAVVPVDMETTAALVTEVKRLRTEQPSQEPVAWIGDDGNLYHDYEKPHEDYGPEPTPLYTTPQQRPWVGLTEEEVMEMMGYEKQYGHIPQYARNFVEAIEAKLKEKNFD